jgi:hypothetical protein
MRADLAKCTTERERRGARGKCFKTKYRGKVKVHPDTEHDYPSEYGGFRSSARHRHWESKNFTDVLNPLRGNIRKNIGRPWDKVFSEFCQVLDRRGVSGYHIWTHLMQEVETKTYIGQDGKIYEKPSRYSTTPTEVSGFYVHPISGFLCYKGRESESERRERWSSLGEKKSPEFYVPGDEAWKYKDFDGVWFRYKATEKKTIYGTIVYDLIKRQCNKKEVALIRSWLEIQ